jgi:hypothetical protein
MTRLISIDLVFISTLGIDVLLLICQLHILSITTITKESSLSIEIKSTHHIGGHLFIELRKSTVPSQCHYGFHSFPVVD